MSTTVAVRSHTAEDAAKILGVPVTSVRELAIDSGLRRENEPEAERFSFQDLVVLRAAQRLRQAKVPRRRIRSALRGLGASLPRDTPLAAVRIAAHGGEIVADDGQARWNPESGQVLLDFSVSDAETETSPLVERRAVTAWTSSDGLDAEGWYERACELEASGASDCAEAYRRALECDPEHFDANLDLGRYLHEEGELEEAVHRYERALEIRPGEALPAFNLGVAMEDLGRTDEAIRAYLRALAADPECADAHYNVARLYETRGERAAAVRHLKSYRLLVRRGS